MSEINTKKPSYNEERFNHEYDSENNHYENVTGEPTYLPSQYSQRGYTDTFYNEQEDTGAGSFLLGAVVGGVIGAATALFLAPKTGKEMRNDFSSQAVQLKDKSIELSAIAKDKASEYGSVAKEKATTYSTIAKDKATEFASTAKEKTGGVTKTIQKQSGQLVDKVKSVKNNANIPMDDGTVSFEGEEAIEFIDKTNERVQETLKAGEEKVTQTAEALKEAVAKNTSDK
ncbi:YtxH domain-containing protein [Sporosarcina ureilytica]|uniref:General stress protein n=1 Tax=Sporosarcina ureilytica TaxID=298596 RepID=A0A1D8JES6_9BACL|nr:YtxH domain-containing protein [Sporosarcina ureilytica]AOV07199.1 hypothetical protein BI350_06355 [Sporosarcina ureilytica]